ncbi:hypothetical protein Tco_1476985 [Tanacetum coccineum]
MVNQEQIPPQQEQPVVAAKQVSFNLEDIILNINNEVTLLYLEHNNKDYFKCVFDSISKCCLRNPFTRSPNMYKEYLGEFWYSATDLENSKVFFSILTGGIFGEVRWFLTIGYGEDVLAKGTLKKSLLSPRWRLLMAQIIQCLGGKTGGFDQITNKDAIILYSLANCINIDYANIFWEDIILKLKKKQREKFIPYTRFISLLIMHKIKEGYRDDEVTQYPTQVFSVNNWALKPNQPEEPPFTDHMLAICNANEPVAFKAPKPSSIAERVPQGTKPGAQPGHKKQSSSKQTFVSRKEATKYGSSKAPTGSKTGHSKKRKESNSAMDSNLSQHLVSTPMVPGMHKEDDQATGGPTSLGVTSEARANPHLSSSMSTFNLNEPIYTASFIIHSESASGNDASAVSIAEADPGNYAPSTGPHVLANQTKSVTEGLDTVLTQPLIRKRASLIARQRKEKKIRNDKFHATENVETGDTSVPKSSSLKSSLIQELTNQQELLVKSLKTKLSNILSTNDFSSSLPTELKDIPSKLNELTGEVQGLKNQVHNLEIELLGELKEIPIKLENFTKTVTSLTSQVVELKTLQWELPQEFLSLPVQVATVQAKLKTLDALPCLLSHVTKALNKFAQVLVSASSKYGDKSVPSAGQADIMPAEGEKNTNQATIS